MKKKIAKIEDEIGKIYGYLTVIGEAEPVLVKAGYWSRRWIYRCICGKEKIIIPGNVFSGGIKSCGCKRKEGTLKGIQDYYKSRYVKPVEDRLYGNYSKHWNDDKREFKLTKEQFSILVNSNCHYCGIPPFTIRGNKTKSVTKALNGIDRVDSSKGYIEGNVVPCCIHCNRAKMDRNIEDFKNWVKVIYKNLYPNEIGR